MSKVKEPGPPVGQDSARREGRGKRKGLRGRALPWSPSPLHMCTSAFTHHTHCSVPPGAPWNTLPTRLNR